MLHQITNTQEEFANYITLTELPDKSGLKIRTGFYLNEDLGKIDVYEKRNEITLSKEQLHSIIGTLLHIQSKMK